MLLENGRWCNAQMLPSAHMTSEDSNFGTSLALALFVNSTYIPLSSKTSAVYAICMQFVTELTEKCI